MERPGKVSVRMRALTKNGKNYVIEEINTPGVGRTENKEGPFESMHEAVCFIEQRMSWLTGPVLESFDKGISAPGFVFDYDPPESDIEKESEILDILSRINNKDKT